MTHQPDTEMPNVHPIFLAESDRVGAEEIHDLYWFQERGVNDLSGNGRYGVYKIKATVETIVELMQRMTGAERMDVMSEFCRHCGDTNHYCQCWNDE